MMVLWYFPPLLDPLGLYQAIDRLVRDLSRLTDALHQPQFKDLLFEKVKPPVRMFARD